MKTKQTLLQLLLVISITLGITACKKDKNTEPKPDPIAVTSLSIEDLKKLSTGTSVTISEKNKVYKIKGIIVSDKDAKNIDAKSVVLQEGNDKPGIVINFSANHNLALGDEVQVGVSNQKLEQVNGEIVLNAVPVDSAKKTGVGTITPKQTTIAEIITNKSAWDGTLVKIAATELSGGDGKFLGALNIKDASGSLKSNVLPIASFSETAYPASVSAITGIIRVNGNDTRIDIRKSSDIVVGDVSRVELENFEDLTGFGADLYSANTEFATKSYNWNKSNNDVYLSKYPGSLYDASFATSGKQYVYNYSSFLKPTNTEVSDKYNGFGPLLTNSAGLKKVTIHFAGSKTNEWLFAPDTKVPVAAFDPSKDRVMIGVYPAVANGGNLVGLNSFVNDAPVAPFALIQFSAEYKEVGKWFEFTFTIPTRAELEALKIQPGLIDQFLANPSFLIGNYSTRDGNSGGSNYAPVVFDKIELKY